MISRFTGNVLEVRYDGVVRKIYQKEKGALQERATLNFLEPFNLNVPRMLRHGHVGDKLFNEISRLPGDTPTPNMLSAQFCTNFGNVVASLHRCSPAPLNIDSLEVRSEESILSRLTEVEKYLDPHGKPDTSCARALLREQAELISEYAGTKSILHRDLRLDNTLWDARTQRVHLLDFETSAIGAGPGDLARIFMLELLTLRQQQAFLDGYGLLLTIWEELAPLYNLVFSIEMLRFLLLRPEPDWSLVRRLLQGIEVPERLVQNDL